MASSARKRSPSTVEPSPIEGQREKRQRLSTTCEWILKQPAYKSWKASEESASPILWLHGPPGSGKTFLAQSIVDFIQEDNVELETNVFSYFCDANSTPSSLIRSLLVQLQQHPALGEETRVKVISSTTEPSSGDLSLPLDITHKLWDTLSGVLPEIPNTTLIIDGIDELPERFLQPQDFDLPSKLATLSEIDDKKTKVLLSSRSHANIRRALKDFPNLLVTEELVKEDLERFIESEITKFPALEAWSDLIRPEVLEQSEGNFVWAGLAVKELAANASMRGSGQSKDDLRESLKNISTSLDDLYTSVISKQAAVLSSDQISLRNQILQWTLFSVRPLRSDELLNAIAVQSGANPKDIEADAIEACGSLIKIENGAWKPVHHSLREYLLKEHEPSKQTLVVDQKSSNLMIARCLLSYLSDPPFSRIDEPLNQDFQYTHPLVEYATLYWVHHVSNAGTDSNLQDLIIKFFSPPTICVEWADILLPHYLPRSTLPIPPRPFNTARFFHLFALKGQLVSYFPANLRADFAKKVEDLLRHSYEGFLAQAQSKSGPESLDAVKRLLDLAEVYSWLPAYKSKAVSLLQAASFIISKNPDPSAQQLRAAVPQALADYYKRAGKYEDARKLLMSMLADETLLSDDFARMFALDSLGWVNMRLGDLNAAEPLLRDATDLAAQIYGNHSPMTLRPKVTLAETLSKLGRHEEAGVFCAELKRQLSDHHTNGVPLPKDSISQLHTLGMILMQEGKFQEAMDTYRVVVDDRRKIFGEMHGMTLGAEMQLGIAMEKAGDPDGAKTLFGNLLPRQEKALGEGHPDVKEVKQRLAQL
ncbi:NACHT and ankyrin domain protein [Byssothecium circinans]|uniref:NACHT and ankyrin domain protein n=1 Tax=Byssothecium circinans TaxID=147558 RepID=A0A6A5UEU7_9PLEO|nr:NACHT and ankyrin domain protein [Byssothecium circinans]